ncbi:helix-turn-helix domain-containing protein [Sphingorhabdus sp. EL138]|uniref:winged helix-turn-helix transcriptional regulator n=1 Tax=Sphingorhabdus sp. EL138 TaxID=2073156 RepID=UPI000D69BAD8|nr:winged helix-turn-helix transcriptional regulator [Sphingorhabdus sp. EL138]
MTIGEWRLQLISSKIARCSSSCDAFYGVTRYDDIHADIGIPRPALTERLQRLVANGVMAKHHYREEKNWERLACVLTPRGRELGTIVLAVL